MGNIDLVPMRHCDETWGSARAAQVPNPDFSLLSDLGCPISADKIQLHLDKAKSRFEYGRRCKLFSLFTRSR